MIKRKIYFIKRKCDFLKIIECIKWLVALCSIFAIATIQLTEWRPLGSANRYEAINNIFLNLSYSYLAAILFHIVMVSIPGQYRKRIIRRQIIYELSEIKNCIQQCINGVYMYNFTSQSASSVSRRRFIEEFSKKNLTPPCDYLELLNKNTIKISSKIDYLLTLKEYLTDKEINILLTTKSSTFLTEPIRPSDYIVDKHGNKLEVPNSNQGKIGKSIHNIYKLFKKQTYVNN